MSIKVVANSIECENCHPLTYAAIQEDDRIKCSNCGAEATEGHGSYWVRKVGAQYALVFFVFIFSAFGYFDIPEALPSPVSFGGKLYFIIAMYFVVPGLLSAVLGWAVAKKQARESDVLSCKK